MNIIPFPGHHWEHCERTECTGCMLCQGGLALCRTCGALEGALTTDCPGVRVSYDDGEAVYQGRLDYRRGEGWVAEESPHSPGRHNLPLHDGVVPLE